jgi:hypothetical protein
MKFNKNKKDKLQNYNSTETNNNKFKGRDTVTLIAQGNKDHHSLTLTNRYHLNVIVVLSVIILAIIIKDMNHVVAL